MDRRDEVINYVIDKYGKDHVAQIITFGTSGPRQPFATSAACLEMPYAEVDRVAKLVPDDLNDDARQALEQEPRLRDLVDNRPEGEGTDVRGAVARRPRAPCLHPRGGRRHLRSGPLTEHVPLYKGAKDEIVTQYSMGDVEKIGLVKFDFLGFKTLTMIQTCGSADE